MQGKTRQYLLRVLIAMLYMERTGDARTYWLLLPKRLKFGRTAMSCYIRAQSAATRASMFERYNHFHDLLNKMEHGAAVDLTEKVFRIPFKAHKTFYVTSDE